MAWRLGGLPRLLGLLFRTLNLGLDTLAGLPHPLVNPLAEFPLVDPRFVLTRRLLAFASRGRLDGGPRQEVASHLIVLEVQRIIGIARFAEARRAWYA